MKYCYFKKPCPEKFLVMRLAFHVQLIKSNSPASFILKVINQQTNHLNHLINVFTVNSEDTRTVSWRVQYKVQHIYWWYRYIWTCFRFLGADGLLVICNSIPIWGACHHSVYYIIVLEPQTKNVCFQTWRAKEKPVPSAELHIPSSKRKH